MSRRSSGRQPRGCLPERAILFMLANSAFPHRTTLSDADLDQLMPISAITLPVRWSSIFMV